MKLPLFAITLVLSSCLNPDPTVVDVPDKAMSPDSFAKVLTDLSFAESVTNMNVLQVPAYRMDTAYAFDVMAEHHISKTRFDSTIAFYSRHPELYRKVYDMTLQQLDELKSKKGH